jgi:pyruvate ferredoxin oxidoreductase gamma subunit
MADIIEIRWHARAGQGAITAANTFATVMGELGKHVQAYAEYGAEKRGAPVVAFTRISEKPILLHCGVITPDVVAVLDPSLLKQVDFCEGLSEDGIIMINSSHSIDDLKKAASLGRRKLYLLDATKIAMEELNRNLPNTPMLGTLVKSLELIGIDDFLEKFKTSLPKKFPKNLIAANISAVKRGYEEVKVG